MVDQPVMPGIVHPKMYERMGILYNSTCTIQYYDEDNLDEWGQPDPQWVDLPNHIDLECSIAPSGGQEVKQPDKEYDVSTHHISFNDYYPDIEEKMRAVVNGKTYDIQLVEHGSRKKSTRLTVEVVDIG